MFLELNRILHQQISGDLVQKKSRCLFPGCPDDDDTLDSNHGSTPSWRASCPRTEVRGKQYQEMKFPNLFQPFPCREPGPTIRAIIFSFNNCPKYSTKSILHSYTGKYFTHLHILRFSTLKYFAHLTKNILQMHMMPAVFLVKVAHRRSGCLSTLLVM